MSKIQIFIDNFETITLTELNLQNERISKYKTARASAIAITYPKIASWPFKKTPGTDNSYGTDPDVRTVGDVFKFVYPFEEGG